MDGVCGFSLGLVKVYYKTTYFIRRSDRHNKKEV
jgi:hypothetical protein